MTVRLAVRVALGILLAVCCLAFAAAAQAFDIKIVNSSGKADDQVYVMLSAAGGASGNTLPLDQSTPLSAIPNHTISLSSISSGRVYLSYGQPLSNRPAPSPITSQVRFDKFELTYPGVVNATAVDFLSIPLQLQTFNAEGQQAGSTGFTADTPTVLQALEAIPGVNTGAGGALVTDAQGNFLRFLSPSLAPNAYPSMLPYVASLVGQPLRIVDSFGSTQLDYTGAVAADGTITLNGKIKSGGGNWVPGGQVVLPGSTITSAVYTQATDFTVGGATANVGDNDVYSIIYRDLVAGFADGQWGGMYGNLFSTIPSIAPGGWAGQAGFGAARLTSPSFSPWFNQYGGVINQYSNVYGTPFGDTGEPPSKNPALAIDSSTPVVQVTIPPDNSSTPPPPSPPSVPTGLAVGTVAANSVALSWRASTSSVGVAGYEVDGLLGKIMTVSSTSATVTGLSPGTGYSFTVRAFDAAGNFSAASAAVSATTSQAPSGGVGPLFLNGGALSTQAPPAGSAATIASAAGKNYDGTPSPTAQSYVIHNVNATLIPGAVTKFTLPVDAGTHVGNGLQLRISYDFNGTGTFGRIETYNYFATDDRNGYETYTQAAGLKSAIGQLADMHNGTISVQIWNAIGTSPTTVDTADAQINTPYTNSTTPPPPSPPSVPTGLAVGTVAANSVALSWRASTSSVGVAGYEVDGLLGKIMTVSSTSATVTGLSPGTGYSFTVRAFDAAGNFSAASAAVSATTSQAPSGGVGPLFLNGGALSTQAPPAGSAATIASAAGKNYDGTPSPTAQSYVIHNVNATLIPGAVTKFTLPVDAGTHVGNGLQLRISYDFNGTGTFGRIETYNYFATDDRNGYETYTQAAGLKSAIGQLADMHNGTISVQIWNAIGTSPTTVDTADAQINTP